MPLFLSYVAVKIGGLCSVYIPYGAKGLDVRPSETRASFEPGKQQRLLFIVVIVVVVGFS